MYTPTEHMAADKMIMMYTKKKVFFQQYIPKKDKRFGFKIYTLCDSLGCNSAITMYLGK
jgi:hypothetical protein